MRYRGLPNRGLLVNGPQVPVQIANISHIALLDTGARHSYIDEDLLRDLGLLPNGMAKAIGAVDSEQRPTSSRCSPRAATQAGTPVGCPTVAVYTPPPSPATLENSTGRAAPRTPTPANATAPAPTTSGRSPPKAASSSPGSPAATGPPTARSAPWGPGPPILTPRRRPGRYPEYGRKNAGR